MRRQRLNDVFAWWWCWIVFLPGRIPWTVQVSAFVPSSTMACHLANTDKRIRLVKRIQKHLIRKPFVSICFPISSIATNLKAGMGVGPMTMTVAQDLELSFPSFYLSRIVLLRGMAFIYVIAFWIALHQNKGLIGDTGISPARYTLNAAQQTGIQNRKMRQGWLLQQDHTSKDAEHQPSRKRNSQWKFNWNLLPFARRQQLRIQLNPTYQFWRERLYDRQDGQKRPLTTILWLAKDRNKLNPWLDGTARTGLILSLLILFLGSANLPILLALWICQRSLMAVGGPFYAFGWEPQLAELNFHLLFLVPLFSLNRLPTTCPPSPIVLFTIRWFLCRIMFGAGLIKVKSSDSKWRWPKLSAMDYFYETQPVPNPLSRYFHWMPHWWHQGEVIINHFVELIAPVLLIAPVTTARRWGGIIQIAFQTLLVTSGNLSFLNWLTAVPALACLDDAFLGRKLFSQYWRDKAAHAATVATPRFGRSLCSSLFGILIGYLSNPVVKNLTSKKQIMNGSFGPWRLVNTYGAFGQVNEERNEFIISAAASVEGPWQEYEFKVKPGNVFRRPRFLSPFHSRLDWQMWIAATMGYVDRSPWMHTFLLR
jgi:lipase maturation factor 1